jgi:sulfite reductase alpha subunit-like flavoprotein
MIGKVFENKSHWNKDGKDKVVIVAHDHQNKKYYVQHILTGVVDWVDESGNGKYYECGGTWLRIDFKDKP